MLATFVCLLAQRALSLRLETPRAVFRALSAPLFVPLQVLAGGLSGLTDRLHQVDTLRARITELETRTVELELAARLGEESRLEAERLKQALAALGATRDRLPREPLFAHVIGAATSSHEQRLTLNRGRNQGVQVDSPVIYGEDVLGRVIAVGPESCRVLLIQDPVSALGILIEGIRTPGVAHGTGEGTLSLSELPDQANPIPGTRVLTGSLSSYYPKGLVVGVLKETPEGWSVQPRRDPLRLEEAFILPLGPSEGPASP